jgi:hypothetical protein
MTDLIAHIREVIDQHAKPDCGDEGNSVVAVYRDVRQFLSLCPSN